MRLTLYRSIVAPSETLRAGANFDTKLKEGNTQTQRLEIRTYTQKATGDPYCFQ
jgi:hypothetical protein